MAEHGIERRDAAEVITASVVDRADPLCVAELVINLAEGAVVIVVSAIFALRDARKRRAAAVQQQGPG